MIQKPKGDALLFKNNSYYVLFYDNGIRKRKSMSTPDFEIAKFRRDLFFQDAAIKPRKEYDKGDDKYIYKRLPYYVKIGKVLVGQYKTRKEAREAKAEYLAKNS